MTNSTLNSRKDQKNVKMQGEKYILSCYSVQNIADYHKSDFVTVKNIINIFYPSQKHHDSHENGKSERKNYIITCRLNQRYLKSNKISHKRAILCVKHGDLDKNQNDIYIIYMGIYAEPTHHYKEVYL